MNEIVVIYPVSELDTLTVDVSQPDGSDRDIGVALSDAGHLNIYLGSSALDQCSSRIMGTSRQDLLITRL